VKKENPLPHEVYLRRAETRALDIRGDYFRDQTAVLHSSAFRRLKHKAQVFLAPQNDHVCTRIEHVLHVASIASTLCRGLGLDNDLAQAIALGHDLGHAPFGHSGERIVNEQLADMGGFKHELFSLRVADCLLNEGRGLNLTYAVRDGMISHCGEKFEQVIRPQREFKELEKVKDLSTYPTTFEGCVVRQADKIAYLGRDVEDAVTVGLIDSFEEVPAEVREILGGTNGEVINTLVLDVIEYSKELDGIGFSPEKHQAVLRFKDFNYRRIYQHPRVVEYEKFCGQIIRRLFDHFLNLYATRGRRYDEYEESSLKMERKFGSYLHDMEAFYERTEASPRIIVADYVAGMTDFFALECIRQLTIPPPFEM